MLCKYEMDHNEIRYERRVPSVVTVIKITEPQKYSYEFYDHFYKGQEKLSLHIYITIKDINIYSYIIPLCTKILHFPSIGRSRGYYFRTSS